MGTSGQNVYIHDSCISDGTLENVLGKLIGNPQQSMMDNSEPGVAIPGSLIETNTTSEQNHTVAEGECQSKHSNYYQISVNEIRH